MLATWGTSTGRNPTLDLQFAGATSLDNRITFARASTATYFDQLGVLQSASNDVARFDYDPSTLAPRGLLIEEQRTNSIRNNTMQGAVAPSTPPTNWGLSATTNGISQAIIGTGTENGIAYIDIQISGTASATATHTPVNFDGFTQIVASSGQAWSGSSFLKITGGSLTNFTLCALRIRQGTAAGAFVASTDTNVSNYTDNLNGNRQTVVLSSAAATTERVTLLIQVGYNSGSAVDITLRIGLPQLELGAFATSVIPTTTTALTRSADDASMTGTNFSDWFNAAEGTLFVEGSTAATAETYIFADMNSGVTNNYIRQSTVGAGTTTQFVVQVTGSTTASPGVAVTLGSSRKMAGAYILDSVQQAVNGTLGTEDTNAAIPTGLSQMNLGSRANLSNNSQVWLARIAYYPTRLPDATLQALTG